MTTSADQQPNERREIYFSGRVQGVGFRYTACTIAQGRPLMGYVQNLFDGRVLLVVEGTAGAIGGYLDALQSQMKRNIEGVDSRQKPATGEFQGFETRR